MGSIGLSGFKRRLRRSSFLMLRTRSWGHTRIVFQLNSAGFAFLGKLAPNFAGR